MVRKLKPKAVIVDIDDTITNFLPFLCFLHNKLNNTSITEKDITSWNFDNIEFKDVRGNETTGDELRATFRNFEDHGLYAILPPINDARFALDIIHELGYRIILMTARNAKYESQTVLNLIANRFKYDELYFEKDKVKKIKELAKTYNIVLFADDKLDTVIKVSENCNCKKIFLIDKHHNSVVELDEEITRIDNLFEAVRCLREVK